MSLASRMTGTVWHVEKMTRQEGDSRRHRNRCLYYNKADAHCPKVVGKCVGAAHCSYYTEEIVIEKQGLQKKKSFQVEAFEGVKMISVSDIVLQEKFLEPAKTKVDKVFEYYNTHGQIDKPIVVSCYGDKYKLEDKYLRFYVAKTVGLKEVPAKIGTKKENELEEKLCKVGKRVKHIKFGSGKIDKVEEDNIVILFDSGKSITFKISLCVKNGFLKPM